jgi:hypothetical protein
MLTKLTTVATSVSNLFFTQTGSLTFMVGLFVGLSLTNFDLMYNGFITIISGSTFHTVKSIGNMIS